MTTPLLSTPSPNWITIKTQLSINKLWMMPKVSLIKSTQITHHWTEPSKTLKKTWMMNKETLTNGNLMKSTESNKKPTIKQRRSKHSDLTSKRKKRKHKMHSMCWMLPREPWRRTQMHSWLLNSKSICSKLKMPLTLLSELKLLLRDIGNNWRPNTTTTSSLEMKKLVLLPKKREESEKMLWIKQTLIWKHSKVNSQTSKANCQQHKENSLIWINKIKATKPSQTKLTDSKHKLMTSKMMLMMPNQLMMISMEIGKMLRQRELDLKKNKNLNGLIKHGRTLNLGLRLRRKFTKISCRRYKCGKRLSKLRKT